MVKHLRSCRNASVHSETPPWAKKVQKSYFQEATLFNQHPNLGRSFGHIGLVKVRFSQGMVIRETEPESE